MLCVILFSCHSITLYYSLSQLTQLEKLNIRWNTLNTVPDVVSSLTSLKQLDMSYCRISSLPERFVCHMFITTSQYHYYNYSVTYIYTPLINYKLYKIKSRIQSVVILPVLNLTVLCYTISLEVTSQKMLKKIN